MIRAVSGTRPKTTADLERARRQLTWVDDDDLDEVEARSVTGATALGLFTWGGGRLMVGDRKGGFLGLGALVAWIAAASLVPSGVGALVYWLGGVAFAAWSYDGGRKVRRFDSVRRQMALRAGPDPSAYRLLAAASLADPSLASALPPPPPETLAATHGRYAPLVDQLRKVAALRESGVLSDHEVAERKVDLFTSHAPGSRAELDELLFALLPLRQDGLLTDDDIGFLKSVCR
jgi:hypothetical protein